MKMSRSSVLLLSVIFLAACNKVSYKKTQSGLAYKIYPGKGNDSLIKAGDVVKFNYAVRFNDSLMDNFTSYGKMPAYMKAQMPSEKPSYDFREILFQLKKGDSVVTVQMADTLLIGGSPLLPPTAKKGDRVTTRIFIVDVFKSDSLAQADYNVEMERDKPRQMKEQEEEMKKLGKSREEEFNKQYEVHKKSGEVDKQLTEMKSWLSAKKITAQQVGKGTFVVVKDPGTGAQAVKGKYVLVKYDGKFLDKDSTFDKGEYPVQLGNFGVIAGWEEGLLQFKEGGKGTLYIPGFMAYGTNPPPGSPFKSHEPLRFEVEILKVSDTAIAPPAH
jgi:FKBP-type peptidyl-prolyl cis-trans isomerase FkpA